MISALIPVMRTEPCRNDYPSASLRRRLRLTPLRPTAADENGIKRED
jgi:hypothetical protein